MPPNGTFTFLFTDIEGSTRQWEADPEGMQAAVAEHDRILRAAIETNGGRVFKTIGDAFCAAFADADEAIRAAEAAQLSLSRTDRKLSVRMALNTGPAEERDNDYFGSTLNKVARILAIGHGGQVLLSESARNAAETGSFRSLGQHRLKDIAHPETIFQWLHPDLRQDFPVLNSLPLADAPNNLPNDLTSFVGREAELMGTSMMLAKTRLLSLHGAGGCGKTRLALKVAEEHLSEFVDGIWLIELAAIRESPLVAQSVATVLGLREDPSRDSKTAVTEHLGSKKVLLILDNAEHLLSACAAFVSAVLKSCPNVKVLVTTREPLAISGEQTYRVPSLGVPDTRRHATVADLAEIGSVRLFIERARLVRPDFDLRPDNAQALAHLCARLDGIPLAIELAAARLRSLTVDDISGRLDNRFRLLTGGDRSALPRQQTLKALVDWSYELLSAQEMTLFQRLSVFAGGWTLEAAEQITADDEIESWEVLDLLTSLADKSLVVTVEGQDGVRYRMLETMRQYASDRRMEQGGLVEFQRNHATYFSNLVRETNEFAQSLERLEIEHDNLRLALDFCLETAELQAQGQDMAAKLNRYWRSHGYLREARAYLDSFLDLPHLEEPNASRGEALFGAGLIAWMQGDYDSAERYQTESLAIHQSLGIDRMTANSYGNLASIAHSRADYVKARQLFQKSLEIRRSLGERQGIANSLGGLGMVAFLEGDFRAAKALHSESLEIRRELGDQEGIAVALMNLGSVSCELDECQDGRAVLAECLSIIRELGDQRLGAFALEALASIEDREQQHERATVLYGAAQTLREVIGSPPPANEREAYEHTLNALRKKQGVEAFDRSISRGRALPFEAAIDAALRS